MKKIYLMALSAILCTSLMTAQSFTSGSDLIPGTYNSGGCVGVTDMNNDGLDDIIILDQSVDLYVAYQQMDGSFSVSNFGTVSGNGQWGMCVGDVDNDGHKDVMCGGSYDMVHIVDINGPGDYVQVDYAWADIFMQGCNLADINNDGWLDGFACHDDGHSAILQNDGTGHMIDGSALMDLTFYPEINGNDNSGNYGSVWTDFDRDGDIDLFIAKCRQFINDPEDPRRTNVLMVNDGNGNFTEEAVERGLVNLQQSWTSDFADMDNDGDFDVLLTTHSNTLEVYENDGAGYFTNVTEGSGLEVSGFFLQAKMADFDNDGHIDLVHSGGSHRFFHNNGDWTFTEQENIFPNSDVMHSFSIGDLNHDGWQDLYASYGDGYISPDFNNNDELFISDGGTNNFIAFDLEGTVSNSDAAGALVEIYGSWGVQIREVRNGESYGITNTSAQHFGIGEATSIDSAVVFWPSGLQTTIINPAINTWYNVIENECSLGAPTVAAMGSTSFCEGGSVMLQVTGGDLNYTWNNGATTSSINASEPGNYFVTVSDANGCEVISQAIVVQYAVDPTPTIQSNGVLEFCEGNDVQLISSEGSAYLWSNGATTQAITVDEPGNYSVAVTGQCADVPSESVSVIVYASTPTVVDVDFTPPSSVTFTVPVGDVVNWYDSQSATVPVFTGNSFTTPVLNTTTQYWVEALVIYGGETGSGGKTENTTTSQGGYQGSPNYFLKFDALDDVYINSVKVYANGEGSRDIDVIDAANNVVASGTFNIPDGESIVNLNFFLPQGTGYGIRCTSGNPQLWRDKDLNADTPFNYPYNVGNLVTITNTNVGGADTDNYYYFFYEWTVSTPTFECESERVEVQAIALGIDEIEGISGVKIYPNPASSFINLNFQSTIHNTMQVALIDQAGRIVSTQQWNTSAGNNTLSLNVNDIAAGVYQLRLSVEGKIASGMVVIE